MSLVVALDDYQPDEPDAALLALGDEPLSLTRTGYTTLTLFSSEMWNGVGLGASRIRELLPAHLGPIPTPHCVVKQSATFNRFVERFILFDRQHLTAGRQRRPRARWIYEALHDTQTPCDRPLKYIAAMYDAELDGTSLCLIGAGGTVIHFKCEAAKRELSHVYEAAAEATDVYKQLKADFDQGGCRLLLHDPETALRALVRSRRDSIAMCYRSLREFSAALTLFAMLVLPSSERPWRSELIK
jgi:hypothetical protein